MICLVLRAVQPHTMITITTMFVGMPGSAYNLSGAQGCATTYKCGFLARL
jgi:hypothetical protein